MPEELKDAKYVITRRAGEDFKLVQHPNCNTFNHRKSLRWSGIKAVQIDDFVPSILNQTPATTQLKVNDNFIINDYFDYIENTNISKYMKVIDDVLLQKNGTQKTSAMDRYFEYSYINISPLMCLGYDTIITAIPNIHPENSEFSLTEIEKLYLTPFDERNRTNNIFKMYAGIILEHYIFETFESMFRYCILHMIENNIMLKKCENCGKYFYPASRSDEKYCNNVLKNGKTCRQLGYEIKVNNDELLKTYRTAYKTANGWKNRNKANIKNIDTAFSNWHKDTKKQLRQAQDGNLSINEYKQWFKDNSFRNYVKRGVIDHGKHKTH